jgi:hypothetical protein
MIINALLFFGKISGREAKIAIWSGKRNRAIRSINVEKLVKNNRENKKIDASENNVQRLLKTSLKPNLDL